MATAGLDGFAALLTETRQLMGDFEPRPYYEPETDSVIFYARNVSSYAKRITRFLTVYLSNEDDSLVGIEVKGIKNLLHTIEGLGDVPVAEPVTVKDQDGDEIELLVLARVAAANAPTEAFTGEDYDELSQATRGVRMRPQDLCAC